MRVYVETYGCQMNEYDSRMIRSMLVADGHTLVSEPEAADAVLVNTCTVRERAEGRALGRLRHLRGLMRPDAVLGVVGCVAQQMGKGLLRRVEGLQLVIGTDQYSVLPTALRRARSRVTRVATETVPGQSYDDRPAPLAASVCDFVAVMRGCDNFCSYCVVPHVRGRERSRRLSSVIAEVEALTRLGARDVTLIGQNVNSYRDGDTDFPALLESADALVGIDRIRFATSHPRDLSDRLIAAIAELPSVCEHVHLPVQSGSDRVLRAMNRSYTRAQYVRLVGRIRESVPGVAMTTDLIVGFPGENERDFEETLSLMREIEFDSAFMFHYSVRSGTAASQLADDVPRSTKLDRLERVIDAQKQISARRNERLVGRTVEILVEGPSARSAATVFGRTRSGRTVVAPGPPDLTGEFLQVRVTAASAWTLRGEAGLTEAPAVPRPAARLDGT